MTENYGLPDLGATWDGAGTEFAVYSAEATSVDVLLFDSPRATPKERLPLARAGGFIWRGRAPGVGPGQLYALSVDGPYNPAKGHRFNKNKALLDPYARAVAGPLRWDDSLFGYQLEDPQGGSSFDTRDSSPFVLKGVVVDPSYDWEGDRLPRTPWRDTVIYEAHAKGYTKLKEDVDAAKRGTYSGLSSPGTVAHLKDLGVTAVELLPVHQHVDNRFLVERGLTNYWGYNTLGFFAPDARYARPGVPGGEVEEFKSMVKELHSAGIEVVLDVVYNHTAEGNQFGPTLSFRGLDNRAYYKLQKNHSAAYTDFTGTGNTLNTGHPFVVKMIMDSLRYWALDAHVDGFRFDLAPVLARPDHEIDLFSPLLQAIHQDPVLSKRKLIAEPWDLGRGGDLQGMFPPPWSEWNGRFRDTARGYWRGDHVPLAEVATRLAGSSDLYTRGDRGPTAGVTFVTCHDGFTLRDLLSYNEKHNEANGEENRDGWSNNLSWNCGVEGPTSDPTVVAMRRRQSMNMLGTLLLSQGVPMILGGDEFGRTQGGNNNAYCQDNETSWVDWREGSMDLALTRFAKRAAEIRRSSPIFRREEFFRGAHNGDGRKDISWLRPDGREMTTDDWHGTRERAVGMLLAEDPPSTRDFLMVLNGSPGDVAFSLPPRGGGWEVILDTSVPVGFPSEPRFVDGDAVVYGRSLQLFRSSQR